MKRTLKMKILILSLLTYVGLTSSDVTNGDKPTLPRIDGSYRVIGEMVLTEGEGVERTVDQTLFEENFDAKQKLTSFFASFGGENATIFESPKLGWKVQGDICTAMDPKEFDDPSSPLKIYTLTGRRTIFPIKQLLGLTTATLKGWSKGVVPYREIPSKFYTHGIEEGDTTITIESHWSVKEYVSASKFPFVPLGFKVRKVIAGASKEYPKTTEEFINIFLFLHDELNLERLKLPSGVYCPGAIDDLKFPDLSSIKALAYRAEFNWPKEELKTSVDAWLDFDLKIFRFDFNALKKFNLGALGQEVSYVGSYDQNVVFQETLYDDTEPLVTNLRGQFPYFPEVLFDPRDEAAWSMNSFTGSQTIQYVHSGKVKQRGIPCDIFRAERFDWPPGEIASTRSVWEWYIAEPKKTEFSDPDTKLVPLISLKIHVPESNSSVDVVKNLGAITYHFYSVQKVDSQYLETYAFDTLDFYSANHQKEMQFQVPLTIETELKIRNQTTNYAFNGAWSSAIYKAINLSPSTLRVTRLKTSILAVGGPMLVSFNLLDSHPKMTEEVRKDAPSLIEIVKRLKAQIDDSRLMIRWGKDLLRLYASVNSLKERATVYFSPEIYHARSITPMEVEESLPKYLNPIRPIDEAVDHNNVLAINLLLISLAVVGAVIGAVAVSLVVRRKMF